MSKILVVKSSAAAAASVSSGLADRLVARLRREHPGLAVVERDLDREPVGHLRSDGLAGIGQQAAETPGAAAVDALSRTLIAEVTAADAIVIAAPMYNFGITSTLKSWFDHVIRAGVTFSYAPDGPRGLLPDRPVVVIESRGGIYSEGPRIAWDAQEPHLRAMLGLIGFAAPVFVRAEGLALGPDAAGAAVDGARAAIDALDLGALMRAA